MTAIDQIERAGATQTLDVLDPATGEVVGTISAGWLGERFGVRETLVGLGLAMVFLRDVDLPFWSPVTGGIMAVTALILLATTYLTLRAAKGSDTTYTPTGPDGQGSARIGSVRR